MARWRWLIGGVALALPAGAGLGVQRAAASADSSCYPQWRVGTRAFDCAGRAALVPGNDSRINLYLLVRDAAGGRDPANAAYPLPDFDNRRFGHTFLDWPLVRAAWMPQPKTDEYALSGDFPGSRCASVSTGAAPFAAALDAARVPGPERAALAGARARLSAVCAASKDPQPAWPAVASAPGKAFLAYLQAAEAFYGDRFDAARPAFATLATAREPWVAETARYMAIRVELGAASENAFDEYGSFAGPEKTDRAAIKRAGAAIDGYLRAYPKGRYANSAQGLRRRVAWLAGDGAALAAEYERLLGRASPTDPALGDLIEEIDNKLLVTPAAGRIQTPLLLAAADLMRMRGEESAADGPPAATPKFTAADLAAQRAAFSGRPALFAYLTAAHAFYVSDDAARTLTLMPDNARAAAPGPLVFSGQVLRGLALAARRDRNEAGFWRELAPGATDRWQRPLVELGMALEAQRANRLDPLFVPGSALGDTTLRQIVLAKVAPPALLRMTARRGERPVEERATAVAALLYKGLTRGFYADWLGDEPLAHALPSREPKADDYTGGNENDREIADRFVRGKWSDGFACPVLRETVGALARAPGDPRALLCLGDFYRLNGFDGYVAPPESPEAGTLGAGPDRFPGQPTTRAAFYARVLANPAAGPDLKAYALYRAVNCYAPSGNNDCGGEPVDKAVRKGWFDRLRRDYPDSPWAKSLKYYW